MDKSILVRRKAQKLAREGRIGEAIEHLRRLEGEAEADPYDYVFLGDLLLRKGERSEAVDALLEAVRSYERVGLNRNAIAICKKVIRLGGPPSWVSRTLGDLYLREGLSTEAVPHLLQYLDGVPEDVSPPEDFYDTLEKAASVTGLQVEAALRLSDHFQRVRREDRASELLQNLAAQAGASDLAQDLEERARRLSAAYLARQSSEGSFGNEQHAAMELPGSGTADAGEENDSPAHELTFDLSFDEPLDPQHASSPSARPEPSTSFEPGPSLMPEPGPSLTPEPGSSLMPEPGLVDLGEAGGNGDDAQERAEEGGESPKTGIHGKQNEPESRAEDDAPEGGGFVVEHFPLPGQGDGNVPDDSTGDFLTGPVPPERKAVPEEAGQPASSGQEAGEGEETAGTTGPEHGPALDQGAGEEPIREWDLDSEEPEDYSRTVLETCAEADQEGTEKVLDLDGDEESDRRMRDEALAALEVEDWNKARALYERLLLDSPLDREILGNLLAVVRRMEDRAGEVRCLIQMGDAWIEEQEYEKAAELFQDVIRVDPSNATAQRRLNRFQEMGIAGAGGTAHPDSERGGQKPEGERAWDESMPGILETGSASVEVAAEPPAKNSDEWVDLGALLEEFKSGVKHQIDGEDFQSHYDLAVSHRSMGLFQESIEEIDSILDNPRLPNALAWMCRELRGACLSDLGKVDEAAEEYRKALDLPADEDQKRWSVLYHLGRALESAEEWREAEETYDGLLGEAPGFLDAEARLRHCRERRESDSQAA